MFCSHCITASTLFPSPFTQIPTLLTPYPTLPNEIPVKAFYFVNLMSYQALTKSLLGKNE